VFLIVLSSFSHEGDAHAVSPSKPVLPKTSLKDKFYYNTWPHILKQKKRVDAFFLGDAGCSLTHSKGASEQKAYALL